MSADEGPFDPAFLNADAQARSAQEKVALRNSVMRILLRELESGRPFTWERAADHAVGVVMRAGGARASEQRAHIERSLRAVAEKMPPPQEAGTLEAFADVAAEVGHRVVPQRHPGQQLNRVDPPPRSARKLAEAALYAEYAGASSDDELMHKALARAVRERRRGGRGRRYLPLDDRDPVRALLDLPGGGPARVVSTDVRVAMVRGLGSVLAQAAPFAEVHARPALGEELWARCRPVGWADARRSRILLEVPSSPMAHELGMQRRDIVRRLQRIEGLEKVKDVRFQVAERSFKVMDPDDEHRR